MSLSPEKKEFFDTYRKENLKRIPLEVTHEMYATIKMNAEYLHLSVNGYIKKVLSKDAEILKEQRARERAAALSEERFSKWG